MKRALRALLIGLPLLGAAGPVLAQGVSEDPLAGRLQGELTENLERLKGKNVTLMLVSGESLSGTLVDLQGDTVRLSQLSGKEFYDAVVEKEWIQAVVFRARSK